MIHLCHPSLTEHFSVALVGAGGNGSQMLTVLARLRAAMVALGHPGFEVTVYDPDTVSAANVGRQLFSAADVGLAKADVLVNRVNAFFGTAWSAEARAFGIANHPRVDLLIGCVDTRKARRAMRTKARTPWSWHCYVMDLGNNATAGQVILGETDSSRRELPRGSDVGHLALPDPYTLLPELVATGAEDDAPSCSLAEALERQELFVNDDVVRAAAQILWQLLRHGRLEWHGAFVNAATGRRTPIPVDPVVWERMRGKA